MIKELPRQPVPYFFRLTFKALVHNPIKVLIVCAHRPGRSPSQRYRFEQYIPFLEREGYSFTWSYLLDKEADLIFYSRGKLLQKFTILLRGFFKRLKDLPRAKNFNLVFIQREAFFAGGAFFEKRFHLSGTPVIFDFDDSIWLADTSPGNRAWEWLKKPVKFYQTVSFANKIIAGNEYLANQVRSFNRNVTVIPTTIDTQVHVPLPSLRDKETLVIGWSGSISTIKHFESLQPVLFRLKEEFGSKLSFKVLGPAGYKNKKLQISSIPWSAEKEVAELNSFDIGIMPLPDDEWSRGKCGLKGLSYMACGVPAVFSAIGVNREIINQGVNGFLANSQEDWYNCLKQLLVDRELRSRVGEAGRRTVEEKYSTLSQQEKYLKVFSEAMGLN